MLVAAFLATTCATLTYAQGSGHTNIALVNIGGVVKSIPSALITVCLGSIKVPVPCTPVTASIFSDIALTLTLADPFNADANGNYTFFAAPGTYTVSVSGIAVTAYSYTISAACTTGSTCSFTIQNTPAGIVGNCVKWGANGTLLDSLIGCGTGGSLVVTNVLNSNVRAVDPTVAPAKPGITATISLATPTVATLSAASTFKNGDGVNVIGAGPACTLSTPAAPTVTTVLAQVMTGTGQNVPGLTGATPYNYKVVARDEAGCLTAASPVGSIATGPVSLGSQSVSITSSSRSGSTVSVITAAHGLVPKAMVYENATSDASFGGWQSAATVVDNTHFTYTAQPSTVYGATTASNNGTVFWFNANHVAWSAVANTHQYYICSDRATPGTFNVIGVSRPADGTYIEGTLYWDDFGSPMMDNLISLPSYVPTACPSVATNDNLVTTIVSGAGTSTITLAAPATNAVTNASILFDNTPNGQAAVTAASGLPVYYPPLATGSGLAYVFNSIFDTANNLVAFYGGGQQFNETLISRIKWFGDFIPQTQSLSQFQFEPLPVVTCNAIPCVFIKSGSGGHLEGLQFQGSGNNDLLILQDGVGGNPGVSYKRLTLVTGATSADYMGMALELRGILPGTDVAPVQIDQVLAESGPAQTNGSSATPLIFAVPMGDDVIGSLFLSRRGFMGVANSGGSNLKANWIYQQGGITPLVTIGGLSGGGNASVDLKFGRVVLDTSAHPLAAYLPTTSGTASVALNVDQTNGPSSAANIVGGNPFISVVLHTAGGPLNDATLTNTQSVAPTTGAVTVNNTHTFGNGLVAGGTATLTGTGACATFSGQVGGSWAGSAQCTSATAASTLTIAPGTTAPHGWNCSVYDETTRANLFQQTSHSTTSCTLTATSVTQNDVFTFSALAY